MLNNAVELHEEAAAEYDAAFDWYVERSPDAALKYWSWSRAPTDPASSSALGRRPIPDSQVLAQTISFTLIYRERTLGDIQVVAVAHTSRNPGYWKQRL
jgi:plasmid stabilization system protein ParE